MEPCAFPTNGRLPNEHDFRKGSLSTEAADSAARPSSVRSEADVELECSYLSRWATSGLGAKFPQVRNAVQSTVPAMK